MHLATAPLLGFLDLPPWSIALLVPLAALLFAGVVVYWGLHFQSRRREMWHETARVALEKGQPLPALLDDAQPVISSHPTNPGVNDLRRGLVSIGVGIGLFLFLGHFISPQLGYVGAIPGCIGVALVISGAICLFVGRKDSPNENRPTQP